jgi:hypothetical protein
VVSFTGVVLVNNHVAERPDNQKSGIDKSVVEEKIISQMANKLEPILVIEKHIENRRLFNMAAGRLRLEEWEQEHLHGCNVCQGVLNVLLDQPIDGMIKNPPKSSDAA